jgi:hypothetical protein
MRRLSLKPLTPTTSATSYSCDIGLVSGCITTSWWFWNFGKVMETHSPRIFRRLSLLAFLAVRCDGREIRWVINKVFFLKQTWKAPNGDPASDGGGLVVTYPVLYGEYAAIFLLLRCPEDTLLLEMKRKRSDAPYIEALKSVTSPSPRYVVGTRRKGNRCR